MSAGSDCAALSLDVTSGTLAAGWLVMAVFNKHLYSVSLRTLALRSQG